MTRPEAAVPSHSRQRQTGEVLRRRTRDRVLAAATAEFADRGYCGATVARIAERADVAVPTLYSAWGCKRALLRAVMATAVTDRDDGFDIDRDRANLMGPGVPDVSLQPAEFLAHLAHRYRLIAERSAIGWRTYRDGAAADPEIAADWQTLQEGRKDTFRVLLANLTHTNLRPGLTPAAAIDTAWAIASPETHELFIQRSGWTYDQYENWIAATLTTTLLGSPLATQTRGS